MTAKRPLSPQAVQAANEKLWKDNPELQGRQLTMDPEDYDYRKQWMQAYQSALGQQETPPSSGKGRVSDPCQACQQATTADLKVHVTRLNDGKPLGGVRVAISGPESRNGTTDGSGVVTFRGIKPGAYAVSGSKANHTTENTAATVPATGTGTAKLQLLAQVDLVVTVVDRATNSPIKGASVRIIGPATHQITTDAAGRARFIGIPTGTYQIEASQATYRVGSASVVVNTGSTQQTVSLEPSAGLAGRVINSNDGGPVAGATVTLQPGSPLAPSTGAPKTTTTNAQGHFDFGEVESGQYQVEASKDGQKNSRPVNVTAGQSTTVDLVIDTIIITSVKLTRSPKKIIHRYNESITFTATVTPTPPPAGLVYHWFVDGVEDTTVTGNTLTRQFTPAATVADRRKDYRVDVRVTSKTAKMVVRVAQNTNVGTANVTQDNAGMDTFGWTDSSPETFDTGLSAAEDSSIQTSKSLTRQIRKQTLADGSTQYGRLQFTSASSSDDMFTTGYTNRSAALVGTRSSAFAWNREEFEGMLLHERQHCQHRTASTSASSIWRKLWDQGFSSTFSPFTEMFGYFAYVQSRTVSYKFLLDYNAINSFKREYNAAKTALGSLSGSTKTSAQALVQQCYDNAQFSELREAAAEGWDHHIDPP